MVNADAATSVEVLVTISYVSLLCLNQERRALALEIMQVEAAGESRHRGVIAVAWFAFSIEFRCWLNVHVPDSAE